MSLTLGIDIGGTKIAGGLVTDLGQVVAHATRPTPAAEGGPHILGAALEVAMTLAAEAAETIRAVGVGTGGQVDARRGVIVSATGLLPGWAGTNVKDAFEHAFQVPAVVDNDVNAQAVGEGRFGAGRGLETVVYLALGTGVGGALLLNGRLHHGAHWSGGEFGHVLLAMGPEARRDAGGHRGTLEAYASGHGLVATYHETHGSTASVLTAHEIAAEAAGTPDGPAAQAIAQTGRFLGFGLVSLANALDPDLIVIGGGLADLGAALLEPARQVLREHALPGPAQCPVVAASLGRDAAVVGAAALTLP